jgi:hypothetical protein
MPARRVSAACAADRVPRPGCGASVNENTAPLAQLAACEQRAAVAFDDALGRRQANALPRERRIVVQALERTEQLVRVGRIEAHAVSLT